MLRYGKKKDIALLAYIRSNTWLVIGEDRRQQGESSSGCTKSCSISGKYRTRYKRYFGLLSAQRPGDATMRTAR